MLDEKNDGKMSKYNELCFNGGDRHTFDDTGHCFECDKSEADHNLEMQFKSLFMAKKVTTIKTSHDKEITLKSGTRFVTIEDHDGSKLKIGFFADEDFADE